MRSVRKRRIMVEKRKEVKYFFFQAEDGIRGAQESRGLGVVPAHTYARLRFDEAAEQAVTHLGYVLQMHQGSPYQGQFVAQSEQRAGAPFFVPGPPGGRRNPIHARDRCESNQFVMMGMRDDWGPRTTLGCRLRS